MDSAGTSRPPCLGLVPHPSLHCLVTLACHQQESYKVNLETESSSTLCFLLVISIHSPHLLLSHMAPHLSTLQSELNPCSLSLYIPLKNPTAHVPVPILMSLKKAFLLVFE
jgi:hypothetical protein